MIRTFSLFNSVLKYKAFIAFLVLLTGCFRVGEELEPQINASVQEKYLKSLPSPFPYLSSREAQEDWAREERIGKGFAQQLDLYQALTAFKRASFLLATHDTARRAQLEYDIVLAYYLGNKYTDVIYTYDQSSLRNLSPDFKPYHDLL